MPNTFDATEKAGLVHWVLTVVIVVLGVMALAYAALYAFSMWINSRLENLE